MTALAALRDHTVACVPRVVRLAKRSRPVILLTGAVADDSSVSLGACLFDFETSRKECFGYCLHGPVLDYWRSEGKEQLICQAELIAVHIAFWTWRCELAQRNLFTFVDIDPANDALIRGSSFSLASSDLVRETIIICLQFAVGWWYTRVPSPSNLADGPPRSENETLLALGAKAVRPRAP